MAQIEQLKTGILAANKLNEDAGVAIVVEELWKCYDKDGSESLCQDETALCIQEIIPAIDPIFVYSDKGFDAVFIDLDTDNSGTIEKSELSAFINRVLQKKQLPNYSVESLERVPYRTPMLSDSGIHQQAQHVRIVPELNLSFTRIRKIPLGHSQFALPESLGDSEVNINMDQIEEGSAYMT